MLPISEEVNALLVRTLEVDWRRRITLREMRARVEGIESFYSDDVLFEDSMARCPWEAGVNVEEDEEESASASEPQEPAQEVIPEPVPEPESEVAHQEFLASAEHSRWSPATDSEMVFAAGPSAQYSWDDASTYEQAGAPGTPARSLSPSPSVLSRGELDDDLRTPSGPSLYSLVSSSPSLPSPPLTPGPDEAFFGSDARRRPAHLTLDINGLQTDYYAGNVDMLSAGSSAMQTALDSAHFEYDPYAAFYVAESEKMMASTEDVGMAMTPTEYDFDEDAMDALSTYSYPADQYELTIPDEDHDARPESPVLGLDLGFPAPAPSATMDSPSTFHWSTVPSNPSSHQQTPACSFLTFGTSPNASSQVPSFSYQSTPQMYSSTLGTTLGSPFLMPPAPPAAPAYSSPSSSRSRSRSRSRKSRILNPVRLAFTRRSRSPSPPADAPAQHQQHAQHQQQQQQQFVTHWTLSTSISPEHPPSLACFASPAGSPARTPPAGQATSTSVQEKNAMGIRRRATKRRLRSAKDWFSPGRLFAAVMPSP